MDLKTNLSHVVLTIGVTTLTWIISAGVLQAALQAATGIALPPIGPDEVMGPIGGLLMMTGVLVGLSTWIVHRSQHQGRRLAGQVFGVLFGVTFFMTQIETLAFNDAVGMPWQVVAYSVVAGLFVCAVVALMSVRLRRKLGPPPEVATPDPASVPLGRGALVGRFSALAAFYVVVYYLCGYTIAWQFPAVREFYSGSTELLSFGAQLSEVLAHDAWLVPFQLVRGFAWAGIALLLVVGLPGAGRVERYVLVGLALSLPLAAVLLVPQGYMPMSVRIGHSGELLVSNFIFGCAAMGLLRGAAVRGPGRKGTSVRGPVATVGC